MGIPDDLETTSVDVKRSPLKRDLSEQRADHDVYLFWKVSQKIFDRQSQEKCIFHFCYCACIFNALFIVIAIYGLQIPRKKSCN
jgi:hypothetical protein